MLKAENQNNNRSYPEYFSPKRNSFYPSSQCLTSCIAGATIGHLNELGYNPDWAKPNVLVHKLITIIREHAKIGYSDDVKTFLRDKGYSDLPGIRSMAGRSGNPISTDAATLALYELLPALKAPIQLAPVDAWIPDAMNYADSSFRLLELDWSKRNTPAKVKDIFYNRIAFDLTYDLHETPIIFLIVMPRPGRESISHYVVASKIQEDGILISDPYGVAFESGGGFAKLNPKGQVWGSRYFRTWAQLMKLNPGGRIFRLNYELIGN